jgi:3-oxoadipate enol-lactonase
MSSIRVDGCSLNVQVDGDVSLPPLMLSNSMGCSLEMWQPQMIELVKKFRVIRYDCRGHGQSEPSSSDYSVGRFGQDVLAILDQLGISKTHWCGISLGGVVGQWIAAHAPERIDRLVLANTTCYIENPTNWVKRISAVDQGGIASIADLVLAGWLTEHFRQGNPDVVTKLRHMLVSTDPTAYKGCCETLSQLDQRNLLSRISAETLVIAGYHDQSTPLASAKLIQDSISSARLRILDAAHISNVERSREFTEVLAAFLM